MGRASRIHFYLAAAASLGAAWFYADLQLRAAAAFQPAGYNAGEMANLVHGWFAGGGFGGPWNPGEAAVQFALLQPTYFLLALAAAPVGGAKALLVLNAVLSGATGFAFFGYARARGAGGPTALAATLSLLACALVAMMATGGYSDWAAFNAFAMTALALGAAGRTRLAFVVALLAAASRPMGALVLGLFYSLLAIRKETRGFALRGLAATAAWGAALGLGLLVAWKGWGATPGEGFSFLERHGSWARLWQDVRQDWWIVRDRYPDGVIGSGTILGLLTMYLLPTGLLPLRLPHLWLAAAPPIALVMGWGFAVPTALQGGLVVFFAAAAEALSRLRIAERPIRARGPLALWLLGCGALSHYVTPPVTMPIPGSLSSDEQYYDRGAHAAETGLVLRAIASDASVLADYGFMTHLWDRRRIDFIEGPAFPKGFEYVLVDLKRPSLMPSQQDRLEQLAILLGAAEYGVVAFEDGVLLLKAGAPSAQNARVLDELANYVDIGAPKKRR